LSLGNTTGFNNTGTGGFTSGMSVTRTFTCGTTPSVSGSIAFNGSTQYLSRAANAAFNLASGDFTIEAWVYITSYADSNFLFTVATASETGGTDSFGFGTTTTTPKPPPAPISPMIGSSSGPFFNSPISKRIPQVFAMPLHSTASSSINSSSATPIGSSNIFNAMQCSVASEE
jgi:hypothetical protein